jgi:serine/threonine protein kinase
MDRAVAPHAPPATNNFRDGLGERRRVSDAAGDTFELLCLRRELTAVPSFEFALRERASRLAAFRHDAFARVRSIDRLSEPSATLAVVSEFTRGVRLSHLLTPNGKRPVTIDLNTALHLVRQMVAAVAAMHENARDVAHGAIALERVIVTANARIIILEYVLGAALEQLRFSPERYWKDLRIALPPGSATGGAKFDHRADITQLGVVALSLVLGRTLTDDEHPANLGGVLASARAISPRGGHEPLPGALRDWIGRALQLDPRHSFGSAAEARVALDKALSASHDATDKASRPVSRSIAVPDGGQISRPEPASVPAQAIAPPPLPPVQPPVPAAPRALGIAGLEPKTPVPRPASRDEQPNGGPTASKLPSDPPFNATSAYSAAPAPPTDTPARDIRDDLGLNVPGDGGAKSRPWKRNAMVAGIVLSVAGGAYGAMRFSSAPAAPVTTGTLHVTSNPPGAHVYVDRYGRGMTPLTLTLRPGPHSVELRGIGEPRTVDVNITAGAQTSQYIELASGASAGSGPVPVEPPPSQIAVDGVSKGKAPAPQAGPAAGPASPPQAGWLTVRAPVDVEIREGGKMLGTSQSERIMVAAGRHELEIVSDTLGYRATAVVQVPPGKVAPIKIEWPKGIASLNAEPWAEVWIEGQKIGDTPIGNLSLPIGPHEIVFRHPELGEQRHAVSVSLKAPVRLSVDMRKRP